VEKTMTVFLSNIDMLTPEIVEAARFLEREGVIDGAVQFAPGTKRPPATLLIVPQEKLKLTTVYDALSRISDATGMVFRDSVEIPAVSEEFARARGFTEQEIEVHLRPQVASRRKAANEAMLAAKKVYEDAVTEVAAAQTWSGQVELYKGTPPADFIPSE
jgi:hypothetical protein